MKAKISKIITMSTSLFVAAVMALPVYADGGNSGPGGGSDRGGDDGRREFRVEFDDDDFDDLFDLERELEMRREVRLRFDDDRFERRIRLERDFDFDDVDEVVILHDPRFLHDRRFFSMIDDFFLRKIKVIKIIIITDPIFFHDPFSQFRVIHDPGIFRDPFFRDPLRRDRVLRERLFFDDRQIRKPLIRNDVRARQEVRIRDDRDNRTIIDPVRRDARLRIETRTDRNAGLRDSLRRDTRIDTRVRRDARAGNDRGSGSLRVGDDRSTVTSPRAGTGRSIGNSRASSLTGRAAALDRTSRTAR